jgi:hypothetical protein
LEGKDNKPRVNYITFPAETGTYFVKHVNRGGWDADLEEPYVKRVAEMRQELNDFDLGLTGIIFGNDGSHIYQLEAGFYAFLEGEADNPDHMLYQVRILT